MSLDAFDNYDRVIHNESDGQHESEHRKRVDRETKQWKENERTDQRDGHREQRNERRAPILKKYVDDNNDQHDGDQKRLNDFFHAFGDGARLIQSDRVVHVLRQALLHLRHQLSDSRGRFHCVGARQLIDGDNGGRLAIQAADHAVILRA